MIERAEIYKNRVHAAIFERLPQGTIFRYLPEYEGSGRPLVASELPFGREVVRPPGSVPAFFAGLLPEGRRLTALRRAIKASLDDELSLLCTVGSDTIGDVQIFPAGVDPHDADAAVELTRPEAVRFADILSAPRDIDRVGLPGAQDKVSGRMIAVPAKRASQRFILKLNPPEFPHLVENEAYFITLARRCNMPVVEASVIHDVDGEAGLLVTRFDRVPDASGLPGLLAVEDACQALGRWPAEKYSMSAEAAVNSLSALCAASALAARDLLRQIVFAILTGNGDQHAKNIAVLADRTGEFRVSPAYDLPSTAFYDDPTLALTVQGRRSGISRRILVDFAEAIGVPRRAADSIIRDLLVGTADMLDDLQSGALPFGQQQTMKAIKQLAYRRRLLTT